MHELSLAHQVHEIVVEEASAHQIKQVHAIHLKVGLLRGVVPDALKTCLGFVGHGTITEGAQVIIDEIQGRAQCSMCHMEFDVEDYFIVCPACGVPGSEVLSGNELHLTEIEGD